MSIILILLSIFSFANSFNVAVIGSGPAGALAAISLAKKGHVVNVFDQKPLSHTQDICTHAAFENDDLKNYNLVLNKRGIDALDKFDVDYSEKSVDITHIMAHKHDSAFQRDSLDTISISRSDLLECIKDAAKNLDITFHHSKLIDIDFDNRVAILENKKQSYDLLIGADGANSKVRSSLRECVDEFGYDEIMDDRFFKTFKVTKEELEKFKGYDETWGNSFHVWQSTDSELICPPCKDGGLTVSYVTTKNFNMSNFPEFKLGERTMQHIEKGKPRVTKSVYCTHAGIGRVLLIGDACHAALPSLGQGVNAALEDSVYLEACCGTKESPSAEDIVTSYNNIRLGDSYAVTKLSQIGFGGSDRRNHGKMHSAMRLIGKSDISYSEILDIIEGKPEIPII